MKLRPGVTATTDMVVLPGVLGCRPLRRTVQVRLGFDLGFRILDLGFLTTIDDIEFNSSDFAICSLVLKSFSANFQSAIRNPHSAIVDVVILSSEQICQLGILTPKVMERRVTVICSAFFSSEPQPLQS